MKHLVYSGLEHVEAIIGKPCPHFDGKGIVEEYLDKIGVPNTSLDMPSTRTICLVFSLPRRKVMAHTQLLMPHKSLWIG